MRRHLLLTVLLLTVAFPPHALAQKKPDNAPPAKDKKEATDRMVSAGEITGKVIQWGEGSQKYLTMQVTIKYGVPNVGALNNIANLEKQAAQVATNPNLNPLQRAQQIQQIKLDLAKNQQQAITIKEESQNVELQLGDEVKVRRANPPPSFDEKGNLKKPTAKELKELKGPDPKLPGFTADVADIASDQMVTATLAKKKDAKPAPKDKDDKTAERPQVTMLVILAEPKK